MTVLSPSGTEFAEVIEVADDYDLPSISNQDDWVEIEGVDGSVWALPPQRIIGIVLQGNAAPKKKARGGRIDR